MAYGEQGQNALREACMKAQLEWFEIRIPAMWTLAKASRTLRSVMSLPTERPRSASTSVFPALSLYKLQPVARVLSSRLLSFQPAWKYYIYGKIICQEEVQRQKTQEIHTNLTGSRGVYGHGSLLISCKTVKRRVAHRTPGLWWDINPSREMLLLVLGG